MKILELATERVRVYPSTYERINRLAKARRTSMAQIIHEKFQPVPVKGEV